MVIYYKLWRRIMKGATMSKISFLVTFLFVLLLYIYVSGAEHGGKITIKREQKVPSPALMAL